MPEWLTEVWEFVDSTILPHAWGIGYVLGFAFVGQVMKARVWNRKNVRAMAAVRDRLWNEGSWARVPASFLKVLIGVPLAFHPLFGAALLGCFQVPISDGIDPTFWNRVIYVVVLGGIVSQGFYSMAHALMRKRGLDFRLPGETKNPKPIPKRRDEDE
jgi:hypothetical protein